jgi:hypothetical protein
MYNWCVVLPLLFLPILSDIILVKPSLLVIVPSCPVMVRGVWSVVKAGKASVDVSNLRCRRCRHLSSPCLPKAPLPFEWALTGEPSKNCRDSGCARWGWMGANSPREFARIYPERRYPKYRTKLSRGFAFPLHP